ncbi:nudix hydrolase homolog 9, partial [Prunus dulcis]
SPRWILPTGLISGRMRINRSKVETCKETHNLNWAGRPAHMTYRATMQAAALQAPTSQVFRITEEFDRHWSALAIPMEKAETETSGERYKLLLSCPSGLLPSQVSVVFDGDYDRIPHPDINLENSVSEIWDQRVHKNPSLYNGTKFRYGKHIWHDGGGSNQEPHLCFCVDDAIRCQHTSSPLGNGAIVETSDKKILVLQRSNNVGEFPGHFVFPGGHPEGLSGPNPPQEVGLVSHHHEDLTDSKVINDKVSHEMFDSIVREVVEEIGVPSASLHEQVFIGISCRVLNVRPTAFFFMKCSLSSKEVQKLYATAQDSFESTQLFTVPMIDLENMASKMPGCHEGGLALYKLMVEAVKNVKSAHLWRVGGGVYERESKKRVRRFCWLGFFMPRCLWRRWLVAVVQNNLTHKVFLSTLLLSVPNFLTTHS